VRCKTNASNDVAKAAPPGKDFRSPGGTGLFVLDSPNGRPSGASRVEHYQHRSRPRRKNRSTNGSEAAPVWRPVKSAGWPDVRTHKRLRLRGVATAAQTAHQTAFLRPVRHFWGGAGRSATVSLASHRDWNSASASRVRKHRSTPSAERATVRKAHGASWSVPRFH
jgi:hypothetical protein